MSWDQIHFPELEMLCQRGSVTCSEPQSWEVQEQAWGLVSRESVGWGGRALEQDFWGRSGCRCG